MKDYGFIKKNAVASPKCICPIPFDEVMVGPETYPGTNSKKVLVRACCDYWLSAKGRGLTRYIDGTKMEELLDVWNSPSYVDFRRSVREKTYEYCDTKTCPRLISSNMAEPSPETLNLFDTKQPALPPKLIVFGVDTACNLMCTSCRTKVHSKPNEHIAEMFRAVIQTGVAGVHLNGSGEVFMNTGLLSVLRSLTREEAPNLKYLYYITNGTLFTPLMWDSLSPFVKSISQSMSVSVDAASEPVYNAVRKGGIYKNLIKNLRYIGELYKQGTFNLFDMSFTVQKKNVHEIESFMELAAEVGASQVQIVKIENWGVYPVNVFQEQYSLNADELSLAKGALLRIKSLPQYNNISMVTNLV